MTVAGLFDGSTVTLGYKGYPYYARNLRYWLRSRTDCFVYEDSDDPETLRPSVNEHLGIWDRQEGRYV